MAPENAAALYVLALDEKKTDHPLRAAELFAKVARIEPRNADARYMLGQTLARLGRTSEAFAEWKKAIEIQPEHAEALYNLSRALSKTDPAESNKYQARFVDLQKKRQIIDRAEMLGNFALASAAARDWPQAVAQSREAIEVCGNCRARGELHKNLGLIYCRSGQLKDGESELRLASALKPGDSDVGQALKMIENSRAR